MAHTCQCSSGSSGIFCSDNEMSHKSTLLKYSEYIFPTITAVMLITGFIFKIFNISFLEHPIVNFIWYLIAYLFVGIPVIQETYKSIKEKDIFNEFTLMTLASIGAFYIGEYAEAAAVMLFYTIGELFQEKAVMKAQRSIKSLLDIRPDTATLLDGDKKVNKHPKDLNVDDLIEVKPGERIPLDGIIINQQALFNTSALTGESIPRSININEEVLAGMISFDSTVIIKVKRPYSQSAISKIIEMVQNASERKANTELLIRKLARIYTPVVTLLSFLVVLIPFIYSLISPSFIFLFDEWLYRSLIFLVISCPCALVVSIPLGYFGGIGAASSKGILFKGSNYLEALTKVNTFLFDKTGTLTDGTFSVNKIIVEKGFRENELLKIIASVESQSNHPLARSIVEYVHKKDISLDTVTNFKELSGYGIEALINNKNIIAGNIKIMNLHDIKVSDLSIGTEETVVYVAIDNKYAGAILLSDMLKPDAIKTISELKKSGIEDIRIISGDNREVVEKTAKQLSIDKYYSNLFPQDKAGIFTQIKNKTNHITAFVGDGINDAPTLALSDVGIAMGALGSDIAIETADIVIQSDKLSSINDAIKIAKLTKRVVYQNIAFAFGVKILVLLLGIAGYANLWEAVFADVGVALIAILNSVRIQWTYMKNK